jgi:cyclopropane fatty-acyl-phospholipid synthase-like methyltransferase
MLLNQIPKCVAYQNLYALDENTSFAYCDGMEAEKYILEIISQAKDCSCSSLELQNAIKDRPSEYHLTSLRSDLFKPFSFVPNSRVLELGCGCGAVTRYFAEKEMQVDAIEGSFVRSKITAERCKGFHQTKIYSINYNDVDFYPHYYDYVLLIGVLEYAPLFIGENCHPVESAKKVLKKIRQALKRNGHLILAIENKLGMKYFGGCHEDHTGIEYDGILDYPSTEKVVTFSKKELQDVFSECGFPAQNFYYPFPDYKIPSCILSSQFIQNSQYPENLFARTIARSYSQERNYRFPEILLSKSLKKAGLLENFANSFLVVASPEKINLNNDYDFVNYPSFVFKKQYQVSTYKKQGENWVRRTVAQTGTKEGDFIFRFTGSQEHKEEYWDHELFQTVVVKSLFRPDSLTLFTHLMQQYHQALVEYYEKEGEITFALDFCFWNLVYDNGKLIPFDLKWGMKKTNINFFAIMILRCLYFFFFRSQNFKSLLCVCIQNNLLTIQQWAEFIFQKLNITLEEKDFEDFLDLEYRLQTQAMQQIQQDAKQNFRGCYRLPFTDIYKNQEAQMLLKDTQIASMSAQIASKDVQMTEKEAKLQETVRDLQRIYQSRGWKILLKYYWLRNKLFHTEAKETLFLKNC